MFFWSIYSFICLGICINVLRIYVGNQRAHVLVVIARICGETTTTMTRSPLVHSCLLGHLGGMLNFNCALILALMLRKHITWLRMKGGSIFLPLDHHINIHKNIGVIILIETLLHAAAHLAYLGTAIDGESLPTFDRCFLAYVFYVCALPKDSGFPCHGNSTFHFIPSQNDSLDQPWTLSTTFRYDPTTNQCIPFEYQGCGGNGNRFSTATACSNRCRKIPTFPYYFHTVYLVHLDAYLTTHHSYVDALFTTKLGLGYLTGVIEFLLGALIYAMCLPYVRKSGYFQVRVFFRYSRESFDL